MGSSTAIQWTDKTFNGWWGCTKVGPGCDHCYADAFDQRTGGAHWGTGVARRRTSATNWNEPRRWEAQAVKTGYRPWVFASSMCDVFDNEVEGSVGERKTTITTSCGCVYCDLGLPVFLVDGALIHQSNTTAVRHCTRPAPPPQAVK